MSWHGGGKIQVAGVLPLGHGQVRGAGGVVWNASSEALVTCYAHVSFASPCV